MRERTLSRARRTQNWKIHFYSLRSFWGNYMHRCLPWDIICSFVKDWSFPLALLSENSSLFGTDGVRRRVNFRLKWFLYTRLRSFDKERIRIYGPHLSPVTNFKGNITGQTIYPLSFIRYWLNILKFTSSKIRPLPPPRPPFTLSALLQLLVPPSPSPSPFPSPSPRLKASRGRQKNGLNLVNVACNFLNFFGRLVVVFSLRNLHCLSF